jgi:cell division protein FtsB
MPEAIIPEAPKPTMISEAQAAADRLRAENERLEKNISQLQELKAFEALGGRSLGAPQQAPVVEESAKDYAARVLKGNWQVK